MLKAVLLTVLLIAVAHAGVTRTYYIAAEEIVWNYGPTGINNHDGLPLASSPESALFYTSSPTSIGGSFIKAQYVRYTDSSFSTVMQKTKEYEHTGLLGPVIYAEVGDTIEVHYKNLIRYNTTFHAHGVFTTKEFEGVYDELSETMYPGNHVQPGETFTYHLPVPSRAGPGKGDRSSLVYPYHSYYHFEHDINAGLAGAIVVTRKGDALPNGKPRDVDKEFFLYYNIADEKKSLFFQQNIETYIPDQAGNTALFASYPFVQSTLRRHINGYEFSNLPGITMQTGDHVRWYVFALGAERDVHTAHWDGQTLVTVGGIRVSGDIVFPAKTVILDMVPDAAGTFELSCHVNTHHTAGMMGLYTVEPGDGYNPDRNFATLYDPLDEFLNNQDPQSSDSAVLLCSLFSFVALLALM